MIPAMDVPESESRVAIWSLSARVVGAYFAMYLLQYVPSVAFEAYTHFQQRAADETLARVMVDQRAEAARGASKRASRRASLRA